MKEFKLILIMMAILGGVVLAQKQQDTFTPEYVFGIVHVRTLPVPMPITMDKTLANMIEAHNRFSSAILEIREIDPEKVDAIFKKYKVQLDLTGVPK